MANLDSAVLGLRGAPTNLRFTLHPANSASLARRHLVAEIRFDRSEDNVDACTAVWPNQRYADYGPRRIACGPPVARTGSA